MGCIGTLFFATIGVISSFTSPTVSGMWMFAIFWGVWMLAGIYLIVAYYRYCLTISRTEIRQTGIFSTKTIFATSVINVDSKEHPAVGRVKFDGVSRIVIRTANSQIKILLGNFTLADGTRIRRLFEEIFPAARRQQETS